jgi:hypothetical protein
MTTSRFAKPTLEALDAAKIIGVRAGSAHRFTGVWVVVAKGRVFARSWSIDKPNGWHRAFLEEPRGAITVGERELKVRAKPVRAAGVLDAVDAAYAAKYDTPASKKWVRGFKLPSRRRNTVEFVPR